MNAAIKIRLATPEDARHLPDVEQSAGELFRTAEGLAWIADSENLTQPCYAQWVQHGSSWVAQAEAGRLVGFLCAEAMEHELHIHEFAVALDFQRHGIGRRLLDTAIAWAVERNLSGVTLTTFRAVAFNERFYAQAGFETLSEDTIGPRLAAAVQFEIAKGLPADRRCAMRRTLVPLKGVKRSRAS